MNNKQKLNSIRESYLKMVQGINDLGVDFDPHDQSDKRIALELGALSKGLKNLSIDLKAIGDTVMDHE